jgi:hypothetical protein
VRAKFFDQIFFFIYQVFCGSQPNLFLGGRLGRLVTSPDILSFNTVTTTTSSENNTKVHSRRRAFAVLTKPVDFKQSVD